MTVVSMDCLDGLKILGDNTVDAIVTDPPYGLAFMGKRWDYDVPKVEVWVECLRVLKPGGHLLAFAGTRTQHRMACRIEDAGFEIRDLIAWVYGSGFPKSLDVSKAIDASDRTGFSRDRALRFTAYMRSTGLSAATINAATGTTVGSHYLTDRQQPAVATEDLFAKLRPLLPFPIPQEVEEAVRQRTVESENLKRRPVVEIRTGVDVTVSRIGMPLQERATREFAVTSAHTDAARRWQGWGTALKPALEPITMARKPLSGTVGATVAAWGTGAINIDGCRVPSTEGDEPLRWAHGRGTEDRGPCEALTSSGRWPANLVHDGSDEVLAAFPEGASRFFYCAKASKRDRDEGLEGFARSTVGDGAPAVAENPRLRNTIERQNTHPTVKPTDLMRYLCRLVTPPGGLIVDPFTGSGSTGKAARLEGFEFLGFELDPDYAAIATARIDAAGNSAVHSPARNPE